MSTSSLYDRFVDSNNGVFYSIYKSIINPYIGYTLYPMASMTLGLTIASLQYGWDWTIWMVAMAHMWFYDEGMKSVDLSADDINLDVNSTIQFGIGVLMILTGFSLAVVLAYWTSIWYVPFVMFLTLLGLAYNLEWFGGILHDRQYVTGWGNLAFCLGWAPAVCGYLLLAETVSLGIIVFAIGPMLVKGTMGWIEEDMKDTLYEMKGIKHERPTPTDVDRMKRRSLNSQILNIVSFIAMSIGLMIELNHITVF
ncbi:hypothetical protein ACH9L7_18950 (plasmid) [Haloferax sp. S1W]|uniref:hypothetical protein n=1 Tax=Haloferax sp. S1W TaxID=3377110 RepID=UPI0037C96CFF